MRSWIAKFWRAIKSPFTGVGEPINELLSHFLIGVLVILLMAATGAVMAAVGIDSKVIPVLGITVSEWMLGFEVLLATAVFARGVIRAIIGMFK